MNWSETDTGYWEAHLDDGSDYCVISYYGKWCSSYNPPDMLGGFLYNGWVIKYHTNSPRSMSKFISKNLKARRTDTIQANSVGLIFATKEEAMAIAERHYRLLILQ